MYARPRLCATEPSPAERLDLHEDAAGLLDAVDRRFRTAQDEVGLAQVVQGDPLVLPGSRLLSVRARVRLKQFQRLLGSVPSSMSGVGEIIGRLRLRQPVTYIAAHSECLVEVADRVIHALLEAHHTEFVEHPGFGLAVTCPLCARECDEVMEPSIRRPSSSRRSIPDRHRQFPGNVVKAIVRGLLGSGDDVLTFRVHQSSAPAMSAKLSGMQPGGRFERAASRCGRHERVAALTVCRYQATSGHRVLRHCPGLIGNGPLGRVDAQQIMKL